MYVVGIDPGKGKCGIALLDDQGRVMKRRVVERDRLIDVLAQWTHRRDRIVIALGDGTGSKEILAALEERQDLKQRVTVTLVDEHLSTLEARRRFFQENPPKGWRRLIPVTMQLPPVPYDDYVAVILAERYLARYTV